MEQRDFGTTGLKVSALGYGAGHIGDYQLSDNHVERLLNEVVDLGITFFDSARGYGLSEERIGKFLSHRREEVVFSTKVGYGVEGVPDWTYDSVLVGIDEARKKFRTDCLDVVFLHSCERHILAKSEIEDALNEALSRKWIKVAGYSGENDALDYAVTHLPIRAIQTSVNVFDQRVLHTSLPKAKQRSMGAVAKRPLGNAPWRFKDFPYGHYAQEYWTRMKTMNLDYGEDWESIALRFVVYTYGVDTAIVGSTNLQHIKQNVEILKQGKLDDEEREFLIEHFRRSDKKWTGQV